MSAPVHQQDEILDELRKLNSKMDGVNDKVDVIQADVNEVKLAARKSGAVAGAVAGGIAGGLVSTAIALLKAKMGVG